MNTEKILCAVSQVAQSNIVSAGFSSW